MSTEKFKVDDHSDQIWTVPNAITFLRFIFIIVAMVLGDNNEWSWALFSLFLAAISDYFDGDIARRYKCQSKLGAFLDPVADKFFMTFILVINFYVGLIVIGLEICGAIFSNSARKSFGGHLIAHGSKAITFSQMTLAIVLILNRINYLAFAQTIEHEIFGILIGLSLCRLFIYSSVWKNKKGEKI